MFIKTDAWMPIALRPAKQLSPEGPLRFQRMLDTIVLGSWSLPVRLVIRAERSDDASGPQSCEMAASMLVLPVLFVLIKMK